MISNNEKIIDYITECQELAVKDLLEDIKSEDDLKDGLLFTESMTESTLANSVLHTFICQSLCTYYNLSDEEASDEEVDYFSNTDNILDIIKTCIFNIGYSFINEGDFKSVEDVVQEIREKL